MKKIISDIQGDVILSYQENGYQKVLDELHQASYIKIITYNINTYEPNSILIKELRNIDKSIPITLILNIPGRRAEYINKKTGMIDEAAVKTAAIKIKYTLKILEREKFGDLSVYFNFENHAKLIMTDKIAYIGSQNFSDASQDNIELGFVINDKKSIKEINEKVFLEIQSKSLRYVTSEYNVLVEQIAQLMRESLKDMREDIFTWVGDPPFIPEIEMLDINDAYFEKTKWDNLSKLHSEFEDIVESLIDDYPSEFNKEEANECLDHLNRIIKSFVSELDKLANFKMRISESMMWDKFHELDLGDNMEEALEDAMDYVKDYEDENFRHIEEKGKDLIKSFEEINEYIKRIEELIEGIRDEMIKKSVYENIQLIKNYNQKNPL